MAQAVCCLRCLLVSHDCRALPCRAVRALQNIPVADAKPDDIKDLLGGALFKALYKWFRESGPVYLLPTGEVCS